MHHALVSDLIFSLGIWIGLLLVAVCNTTALGLWFGWVVLVVKTVYEILFGFVNTGVYRDAANLPRPQALRVNEVDDDTDERESTDATHNDCDLNAVGSALGLVGQLGSIAGSVFGFLLVQIISR